jgi:RNA polymerase sigma-70 factor, ECF subfamily
MTPQVPLAAANEGVTTLLAAWAAGDEAALAQLVPLVHVELCRIARRQMRRERNGHTLQTTALVNEAYLRLIDLSGLQWRDRGHFLAMSARLMRRVLVDHARTRRCEKRGGGIVKVTFNEAIPVSNERELDVIELDDALDALAMVDERKSRVVELRFFGGFSVAETAQALAVSEETVMRDWRLAKVWLLRELGRGI